MAPQPTVPTASPVFDAQSLRQQLMSPNPMERAVALHALEQAPVAGATPAQLAHAEACAQFAARGIPFYGLDCQDFLGWVDKAVELWEGLREAPAAARRTPARRRAVSVAQPHV
jgi:hypothetical protein